MPHNLKDPVRRKFTKKNYNVRDCATYDKGLKSRGSLTIWFSEDAVANWNHVRSDRMKRGRQRQYSDLAIETAHTLRLVYKQPLRQTEGFLMSIVTLLKLDLAIPDHTTLSRRAKRIILPKLSKSSSQALVVIVDSTGLKVVGEKEWMNHKHGTRQRKVWRKLHLAIDESGEIIAASLTTHSISDVSQVPGLLAEIEAPIDIFYGDSGGYDHQGTYDALDAHEENSNQKIPIKAVIPPNLGFQAEREGDSVKRKDNIHLMKEVGRQKWQDITQYGKRAGIENINYHYKTIIGRTLRSQTAENQNTEIQISVPILNKMKALGMPKAKRAA